jgi:hypothetical protein
MVRGTPAVHTAIVSALPQGPPLSGSAGLVAAFAIDCQAAKGLVDTPWALFETLAHASQVARRFS